MGSFVHGLLENLFGQNSEISEYLENVFEILGNQFSDSNGIVNRSMGVFGGVAASLLVIFFFMQVYDQASKDLFTLEKLIVSFIKLLGAFIVLLMLPELMNGLVGLGEGFYYMIKDNSSLLVSGEGEGMAITYTPQGSDPVSIADPEKWAAAYDVVKEEFSPISKIFDNIQIMILGIFPFLITEAYKLAMMFFMIGTTIQILVRAIFAPIGVVQLFEDGTRSAGIKYLKKFGALCFNFAVLMVIAQAISIASVSFAATFRTLPEGIMNGTSSFTCNNVAKYLTFGNMLTSCLVKVAGIGAMMGAGRIADEVFGV